MPADLLCERIRPPAACPRAAIQEDQHALAHVEVVDALRHHYLPRLGHIGGSRRGRHGLAASHSGRLRPHAPSGRRVAGAVSAAGVVALFLVLEPLPEPAAHLLREAERPRVVLGNVSKQVSKVSTPK